MRSASVCSAVALLAPARQTGAFGSFMTKPPSPKILRPLTEGAEYLMVMFLPPIAAVAVCAGLGCAESRVAAVRNAPQSVSGFICLVAPGFRIHAIDVLPQHFDSKSAGRLE